MAVVIGRHRMAEGDPAVLPTQATALNRLSRVAADLGMSMEAYRFEQALARRRQSS